MEQQLIKPYAKRCGSKVLRTINAPLSLVWSVVRKFDRPEVYKKLVRGCTLVSGSGEVGSVRRVRLISGLPGKISVEQLEVFDEENHVIVYRVIECDDKLVNFHVKTMLEEVVDGNGVAKTVVIESYTVDVPEDSNEEDTCYFANTIIDLNLKNLAIVAQKMVSCTNGDGKSCL